MSKSIAKYARFNSVESKSGQNLFESTLTYSIYILAALSKFNFPVVWTQDNSSILDITYPKVY